MKDTPFMLASYPRAILHIDGDAFFTSVEQALTPSLKDKPVVTGQERGIIACASYEAKALGIKRGLPLFEAKKMCPKLIILPNDYESYSLYSKRMFNIMKKYTPMVEENSIDEAYADITGMRRVFHSSYDEIAQKMQLEIHKELDLSVSIGLSITKTLAKLCSKFRKPKGFTAVPGKFVHILLQKTRTFEVGGFGPNTSDLLSKYSVHTAYDYVMRPEHWASRLFGKLGKELWNELKGNSMWKVTTEEKASYATILKSRTFTPATNDKSFVYAKLIHNVEAAFAKARRYKLRAKVIGIALRRHDFRHDGLEAKLNRPTSSALEAIPLIRLLFERIFQPGSKYRASMIVLGDLENDQFEQFELFENRLKIDSLRHATEAMDSINKKYGKNTLRSATSLFLCGKPISPREEQSPRRNNTMNGETDKHRLGIPRLDIKI